MKSARKYNLFHTRETPEITERLLRKILELPLDDQRQILAQLESDHHGGETKRKSQRRICDKHVAFSSRNRVFGGQIKDISNFGVFIESKDQFTNGQPVTMTFELPDSKDQVRICGQIVRVLPNGIGVKFDITMDDLIKKYVKRSAG